jgi:hypothetical protein
MTSTLLKKGSGMLREPHASTSSAERKILNHFDLLSVRPELSLP